MLSLLNSSLLGADNKKDDEIDDRQISNSLLELAKLINVFAMFFVVIIGLAGHTLIIIVFSQKRFRTNSSNVFLLCLALNDSIFIVIHFFEDTIRIYKEIFIDDEKLIKNRLEALIIIFNFVDHYEIACRLVSYLRYILRFTSSYMLVIFTLHRLSIVNFPMSKRFKSKKSAWLSCSLVVLFAVLINAWSCFMFELQNTNDHIYCDVSKKWSNEYFQITALYIIMIIFIPIMIILSSNLAIIHKLIKSNSMRRKFNKSSRQPSVRSQQVPHAPFEMNQLSKLALSNTNLSISNIYFNSNASRSYKIKPHYSPINQALNRISFKTKSSTKNLFLISILFVVLNLPYLVTWCVYYYEITFNDFDEIHTDYIFASLKICEIFYMLNYSLLFYVYCCSGTKFRNQLKYLSKLAYEMNYVCCMKFN